MSGHSCGINPVILIEVVGYVLRTPSRVVIPAFEKRERPNLQPSGLQIQHPGMLRMGYIIADVACAENETLPEKAEKARRQSLG